MHLARTSVRLFLVEDSADSGEDKFFLPMVSDSTGNEHVEQKVFDRCVTLPAGDVTKFLLIQDIMVLAGGHDSA